MRSQYTLDVARGDAIVIVTRAATLRVDYHKMDGDWSLLLQYRADSQPNRRRQRCRPVATIGGPAKAGRRLSEHGNTPERAHIYLCEARTKSGRRSARRVR
jgi:hypothetical protein